MVIPNLSRDQSGVKRFVSNVCILLTEDFISFCDQLLSLESISSTPDARSRVPCLRTTSHVPPKYYALNPKVTSSFSLSEWTVIVQSSKRITNNIFCVFGLCWHISQWEPGSFRD